MRRFASRKSLTSMSLFPFLAVLICTMGALIVLLILVVQQARVQADTLADQRRQTHDEQDLARRKRLEQEAEDWQWQRDILQQQRQELTQQLADSRLELSHLEEHIRRLEENWKRLLAEAAEMKRLQQGRQQQGSAAQAELDRLQTQIAAQRTQLEQLRQLHARRSRSFAIVPYQGPHGTRRRPIYIECRESAIIIQPEGIVFGPQDFTGPLGPGNPLDAALRTIREHWTRLEADAAQGAPYPLLIVRPDGAVAYAMARNAMASWEDEFGYELVAADMELQYPPSDPRLKQLLQSSIQTARERQAILAAAMPSRFDGPSPSSFSLPPGGAGGELEESVSSGRGPGGLALGSAENRDASGGTGGPDTSGRSPGTTAISRSPATPEAATARVANAAHASSTAAGAAAGRAGGAPAEAGQGGGAAPASMALSKGANWGLPEHTPAATGITRPITVHCYPDRLVILPDRRDTRNPQTVPFEGSTRDAMQPFVSGIWMHMERWGMAVAGGYWKPKLLVTVFPGAETRFWELQALLADSGLDVERR